MKKPVFVLRNIKPDKIDLKYNLLNGDQDKDTDASKKMNHQSEGIQGPRTKISDLSVPDSEEKLSYSFLDESKKDHQCVVTMKSLLTNDHLPPSTVVHCFWCRHNFSYRPIGCPIDFVPKRITKTYHSEITKDVYTLRENVTVHQLDQLRLEMKDSINQQSIHRMECDYQLQDRDYYLMDGMFCSFNCCLAFIRDNLQNPIYLYSENYLVKIYYDLFGNDSAPLVAAPSWRLLREYGGHMSIEEYRRNFYKVDYLDINNMIVPFPNSKHVGFLFEKQVKL